MEKLLFLSVIFASCNAELKDLRGKHFVFPTENRAYVELLTSQTNFSSATVCLRFITDTRGQYTLFHLSTSEHIHAFTLQKVTDDAIMMQVQNKMTHFKSLALPANTWHSLCATWRSDNGLAQLVLNHFSSIKRYIISGQPISATPTTILGYDPTASMSQSFTGMISDVHMWDYVVPDNQISSYMDVFVYPGNVLNWTSLEYKVQGQVLVE